MTVNKCATISGTTPEITTGQTPSATTTTGQTTSATTTPATMPSTSKTPLVLHLC